MTQNNFSRHYSFYLWCLFCTLRHSQTRKEEIIHELVERPHKSSCLYLILQMKRWEVQRWVNLLNVIASYLQGQYYFHWKMWSLCLSYWGVSSLGFLTLQESIAIFTALKKIFQYLLAFWLGNFPKPVPFMPESTGHPYYYQSVSSFVP